MPTPRYLGRLRRLLTGTPESGPAQEPPAPGQGGPGETEIVAEVGEVTLAAGQIVVPSAGTSTLSFYDAAYPPGTPPSGADGVCGYIGGDALNVWSLADWESQQVSYRLPIFVRTDPQNADAQADVGSALDGLRAIGAPEGTLVAWDLETTADADYIGQVSALLGNANYKLIVYGSQSVVLGNNNPDDLYWGADWTGVPHIAPGDAMTQWVTGETYDQSLALSTLPFWDTAQPSLEDDMPLGTIPSTEANWAACWEAGSCTWIAFYGGPPLPNMPKQQITVSIHSRSRGYSQVVSVEAEGQKTVIDFDESDVDAVGMARGGDPSGWTPVAFNAGS
jgi:hypothetical protein